MKTISALAFHGGKRLLVSVLIAVILAAVFWSQSRIPALNEKAQMGDRNHYSALAYDVLVPVSMEQALIERVFKSTINWAWTNLWGMTFGLLFAAAVLTIMAQLHRKSFSSPWWDSITGVATGAPLGVCVNCATPIAQGLATSGARLEMALATLVSSPTLNAIVLSMTFTLLPWEMALAKIIGVAILILLIPMLVKVSQPNQEKVSRREQRSISDQYISATGGSKDRELWTTAIYATLALYFKQLFYIARIAVPMMLLAGLLGAAVIELIPFEKLVSLKPSIWVFIGFAFLGTFLPVPIALDVLVTSALLAAGMNHGLATTLLYTLGIFSVYPAIMLARVSSVKLSLAMMISVACIGSGLGFFSDYYFEQKQVKQKNIISQGIKKNNARSYQSAISLCDELPAELQESCFVSHLAKFKQLVSEKQMCELTPKVLDRNRCQQLLAAHKAQEIPIQLENDSKPCTKLGNDELVQNCQFVRTFNHAIKTHDIEYCRSLNHADIEVVCRERYVNFSLYFNPYTQVCEALEGDERLNCAINTNIHQLADASDIKGCDALESDSAQDFCRFTIASSMIGRNADSSACAFILNPHLSKECYEQKIAWQADHNKSYELCEKLTSHRLHQQCLLRVNKKKIQEALNFHALEQANFADFETNTSIQRQMERAPDMIRAPTLSWSSITENDSYTLDRTPFKSASPKKSATLFSQHTADEYGIDKSWRFGWIDFFEPFLIGKGVASGDFNNDGWPDIVLATEQGIVLYQNIGGKFARVKLNQGLVQKQNVFVVAFFDANNDGYQDIFTSAYGGNNYILINELGEFNTGNIERIEGKQMLTFSAGFDDLDANGLLDIILGNWSSGLEKGFSPERSENQVLFRVGEKYQPTPLKEPKGETLSVLASDLNHDGRRDVLIANDRMVPDINYFSDVTPLNFTSSSNQYLSLSSLSTMSYESADFNNDLKLDIFSTDMSFSRGSKQGYCGSIMNTSEREACRLRLDEFSQFAKNNATVCNDEATASDAEACYTAYAIRAARDLKDAQYCEHINRSQEVARTLCEYVSTTAMPSDSIDLVKYPEQVQRNMLMLQSDQKFEDVANDRGVGKSHWSWNARAADFDNDGWQDIYVGNGFHFGDGFYEVQENILFRNLGNAYFSETQKEWGLNDLVNTPSYTYLDLDFDGDLDIISTGVNAPPRVFINSESANNKIAFQLFDEQGNHFAIGSQIIIRYGAPAEQLHQLKEVKLSGGFMSFDQPVLYFGLGKYTSIQSVEITWPDGEKQSITNPLVAGGIYRITRKPKKK